MEFFWHAQSSHVYLELKKLEKKGYIGSETVIQTGRPNKNIFYITDTGREEFMNWLASGNTENPTHIKSAFLIKVFFGGNLTPAQSTNLLRQFKTDCEVYLKRMDSIPESIQNYGSNKESYETMYWQFTADFGYQFIKTCIEWAKQCIEKLENIE